MKAIATQAEFFTPKLRKREWTRYAVEICRERRWKRCEVAHKTVELARQHAHIIQAGKHRIVRVTTRETTVVVEKRK